MSLLKMIRAQLGMSATATDNFTLDASAANGSMKLARGNAGATTQDIVTVDSTGKVDFPAGMAAFLGANQSVNPTGYQKLPGGLILQWGNYSGGAHSPTISFPLQFPNSCLFVGGCTSNAGNATAESLNTASITASSFVGRQLGSGGSTTAAFYWFAVGF